MQKLLLGGAMALLFAAFVLPSCQKETLSAETELLTGLATDRGLMAADSNHCHHDSLGLGGGGHHPHDSIHHPHDSLWVGGPHPHDSLGFGGGHHPHDSLHNPIDTSGHGGGHGGHGGGHGGHGGGRGNH